MVVIGGITRLTHSGLSMVEWNMVVGSLPPLSDADWQQPFEKYKQSPEYKQFNYNFTLQEFKSIYWWEYLHRFLGRFIGIVFIIPFFYFLFRKKISPPLLKKLLLILTLGAFQGVLGWYMVKSGLNKNPHVSHYRLAAHLISAFTVFGVTLWVVLNLVTENGREKIENEKISNEQKLVLKRWSVALLVTVIIQIIYGAFVAGLKAGYLCPTWPKMCDEWMHDSVFALTPAWKNFIEGGAGVQFVHRYVAYIVVILVEIIWFKTKKMDIKPLKTRANLLLGVVAFQFTLGVFTILYNVPVILGVLHQTGAFLLFATTLLYIHQLKIHKI